MSNRRKARGLGQTAAIAEAPVMLRTVPAAAGKDCSWCDCRVPRPVQIPDGPRLFTGHNEAECAGCDRPAVWVVQLDVPFLDLLVKMPVCTVHRGDAEADLSQDFGVAP